ncbi:MAG: hypothetical protein O2779_03360 [Nanoarchaeota archaeon]|nr:hypothetical protein [Nanoarchaeota archaeon]
MKRILALMLVLFVVGCSQAVEQSSLDTVSGDATVDSVVAESEAVAELESELTDDGLDALADDLEGLDW